MESCRNNLVPPRPSFGHPVPACCVTAAHSQAQRQALFCAVIKAPALPDTACWEPVRSPIAGPLPANAPLVSGGPAWTRAPARLTESTQSGLPAAPWGRGVATHFWLGCLRSQAVPPGAPSGVRDTRCLRATEHQMPVSDLLSW